MRTTVFMLAMSFVLGFQNFSGNQASAQQTTDSVQASAQLQASAQQTKDSVVEKAKQIEEQLANNETIKEISAGILQPIYNLAEYMAQPWFYWVAFAVMAAGVVSFALQLVLTKLILLLRMKLRLSEIFSDALGLIVSLTGLVMVTQAATENSTFTTQSVSVVSAAAVGLLVGFVFYLWGQKTELMAAKSQDAIHRDDPKYKL
jgi:hypothetical protein